VIYQTCPQLPEKIPVLLRVLGRRKLNTVFTAHFFFAEPEHRAEGRIHEHRLAIEVFHRNPDGARTEEVAEKLRVETLVL
jgi:hypothetical protein